MQRFEGMLMVGASGSDAGKTTFVCSLIQKFSTQRDITAVKVTVYDNNCDSCRHNKSGCELCKSIKDFSITEERDPVSQKDTCRMLASGAKKVLWLKTHRDHLPQAGAAIRRMIDEKVLTICESNCLRDIFEPDVFLMITRAGMDLKPSAKRLWNLADMIINFDGKRFIPDAAENLIEPNGNNWALNSGATAIILAGGKSRRMGTDKVKLEIEGKAMIEHVLERLHPNFSEVIISADSASRYDFKGVKVVSDAEPGRGPLMGIASAMQASRGEFNFVTAVDIPKIDIALLRRLLRESKDYDAAVPRTSDGKFEPLFAVYRRSMLGTILKTLAAGENKITKAYKNCKIKYIDLPEGKRIENINTMSDYKQFNGGSS